MNIYVESNFVLELTLLQKEYESCEKILTICEDKKAILVIPAYSLVEPYEPLIRRDRSRKQLARNLDEELKQIGRSTTNKSETDTFQAIVSLLQRSGAEQQERLAIIRERLLRVAVVIPLNEKILIAAPVHEKQFDLSPQDAIIYTSLIQHLSKSQSAISCYLTLNPKDFDEPGIKENLANYGCKMLFSFADGYSYIQSQI
jgi:predicted nucleic acid-binding protein